MATDIELNTKINTANAAQSIREINKSLKDLISLQSQVGAGTTEFKKLQEAINKTESKLGDLKDGFKTLSGSGVERLTSSLGLLKEGLLGADPEKVGIAFKGLGSAMSAIPIFLLIEGIKLLIDNFDKVVEFAKSFTKEAKEQKVALRELSQAYGDLASNLDEIAFLQKEYTRNAATRNKIEIENAKQRGASVRELNKLEIKGNNEKLSILQKAETNYLNQKIFANAQYSKALLTNDEDSIKRAKELLTQATSGYLNAVDSRKEAESGLNIFLEEKQTEAYEKNKELQKKNKEDLKNQSIKDADELFKELSVQQDFELKLRNDARAKEALERKNAINQKVADEKFIEDFVIEQANKEIAIAKAVAEQKKVFRDADFAIATAGVGLFKQLVGKNKDLQKAAIIAENAVAIAKMIINNAAANATITSQGSALAIPTAGVSVATASGLVLRNNILTGINVAAAGVATAKALQALGSGGSGVSANVAQGADGGGASVPKQDPQSLAFNKNTVGQVGNIGGNQAQKVVLVSHDVTRAQKSDRLIELQTTF